MHQSSVFHHSPQVIGLTGGISTGKSTVSDYLQAHYHLPILDADVYAREAVAADSVGLAAIIARYGSTLLAADGTLNRTRLAEIVFHQPAEKQWLEGIIHPFVRQRLIEMHARLPQEPLVVMAVPLLLEAKMTDLVSQIWVVFCRPEQQLQRLMARNGLTEVQAQQRIASQLPLAEKCRLANVVLDNSGSLAALYVQVDTALLPLLT
jgi:dephospho-CoA kinase